MPIDIRPATDADIADLVRLNGAVQDLHASLYPAIFRSDWRHEELARFWTRTLADRTSTVALAIVEEQAIGYIWFQLQNRAPDLFHHRRLRIYVHQIGVDAAARRHGVGSALMLRAEAEARSLGLTDVLVDGWAANPAAHAFFAARGYAELNIMRSKSLAA